MGTKAVVVQVEVLKRYMCSQKGDERSLGVQAKGVIVKINSS